MTNNHEESAAFVFRHVCVSTVCPLCLCVYCVCVSIVFVCPLYLCVHCVCVSTVFVCPLCLCVHRICVSTVFVCPLCLCVHCFCVSTVFVNPLCLCVHCVSVSIMFVYPLCVHCVCVSAVFVCPLCLCVHCVCVSIGRSKFRQAKGALKFRHSKLTSSRCRTKNTQNLPENKTHYDRSESLSLSLSHTLYSHISRCHDTSHKSPNCDLPVKKQTILQWYTGTQNMLIRSRYTTCLLPANCTSSYNTTVTVTCFVRLLRVAILREYISQGRYAC